MLQPDSSILASTQRSQSNKEEEKKKESKQDEMADAKTPIQANTPMKSQSQEDVILTPVNPSKVMESLIRKKESERPTRRRKSSASTSGSTAKARSPWEKSKKDSGRDRKPSLTNINTFLMPQDPPRRSEEKLSEPWTWSKAAEIFVLFFLLLDTYELHHMIRYSLKNGGFFFIAAHFILSFLFEFPLLNLFVHIGQYTGTGITKVFGLYTAIFRGLGWSLLLVSFFYSSVVVYNSGIRLSVLFGPGIHMNSLVDCREYPEYDCGVNVHFTKDDDYTCCTSIYHVVNCSFDDSGNRRKENFASLGSVCVQSIPDSVRLVPAMELFYDRIEENGSGGGYFLAGLSTSFSAVVISAILASIGYTFYTYAVAISGAITLVLYSVHLIGFIAAGSLSNGFWAMAAASEIEFFFRIDTLQALLSLTIVPVMKFGIISFSSFRINVFDSFYTILPICIGRKFLLMFVTLANLAMFGFFVAYPKQGSSQGVTDATAEFMLSSGLPSFFFYVSCFTTSMVEWSAIAGLMYIALGIHRDHLSQAASYWKYVLIAGLVAVMAVLVAGCELVETEPRIFKIIMDFLPPIGAFWFCFIGQCTVFVYGQLEHLLDRAPSIPSRGKWTNSVGAASPIYPRWVAIGFTRILVIVFSVDALIKLMNLRKSAEALPLAIAYAVIILPILLFVVFTAVFLCRINKYSIYYGRENLWRLVYPSPEHPSYSRILKNDDVERKLDDADSSGRNMGTSSKRTRSGIGGYQVLNQT